jgi:histidinol-phosphate aminotransferase
LRERIASIHGVRPEHVFVGNGSDEILALCTRAFVEAGGRVGYFDPSYLLYPVLADIACVGKHPVRLGDDFGWRMPGGYSCSVFFLAYPNAPTGILYPLETVRDFCRGFPGVVVLDEAYVDFASANGMALASELPNVLVARTLSKSFSLAGLRVGYAVGAPPLVDALLKLKDSYNVSMVSQTMAMAALSDLDHMRANVARVKATRERLAGALRTMGFAVAPSESNFLWVLPPRGNAAELFDDLRRRGILVRYFPGETTGRHLRISVGTDAQVDALLAALGAPAEGIRK